MISALIRSFKYIDGLFQWKSKTNAYFNATTGTIGKISKTANNSVIAVSLSVLGTNTNPSGTQYVDSGSSGQTTDATAIPLNGKIAYGSGVYICVNETANVYKSNSTLSGYSSVFTAASQMHDVIYWNNAFYICGSTNSNYMKIYKSTDLGVTWTLVYDISMGFCRSFTVYNGYLIASTSSAFYSKYYYTLDGTTWTSSTSSISVFYFIAAFDGNFYMFYNGINYSKKISIDATTVTTMLYSTEMQNKTYICHAISNNMLYILSLDGYLFYRTAASETFTKITLPLAEGGVGKSMIVDDLGNIHVSYVDTAGASQIYTYRNYY